MYIVCANKWKYQRSCKLYLSSRKLPYQFQETNSTSTSIRQQPKPIPSNGRSSNETIERMKIITTAILLAFVALSEAFAPRLHALSQTISSARQSRLIINNTFQKSILQIKTCSFPGSLAASASLLPFGLDKTVALASLSATAKLLSSVGLGSLAALRPNVLDAAAVSALSRLTYWVFQPCFLLCSVASTLAAASSGTTGGIPKAMLLLLPFASLIQVVLGSLTAKVVTKVMKFPDEEARDFTMCTTFGNSGPLPLIFTDALFRNALKTDVTACISFYLLMWSPLFWNVGRMILGTYNQAGDSNKTGLDKIKSEIGKILSPPVIGSILGLLIGGIGCLRTACLQPNGWVAPLYGACNTLGSAYLPAAVLVLAGSLVNNSMKAANGATEQVRSGVSTKAVISIMLSRFILAPLTALATVQAMEVCGLLSFGRAKAVVMFTLLMEGCMPPAQNSVIMYQLDGLPERAGKMAKTLALIYSMAVVPVTLLLSACLALSGIMMYS